jgi:hypothetical protein
MSYCGAIPVESDSHILIDACLARVRVDARLDEDPVLPPLEVLLGKEDRTPSPRVVISPFVKRLPTAEAIVKASVKPAALVTSSTPTKPAVARTFAQRMRWPVFLCGFVAGVFGGVAVMKSPVGNRPTVRHAVQKVQSHAASAYAATAAATSRLVK